MHRFPYSPTKNWIELFQNWIELLIRVWQFGSVRFGFHQIMLTPTSPPLLKASFLLSPSFWSWCSSALCLYMRLQPWICFKVCLQILLEYSIWTQEKTLKPQQVEEKMALTSLLLQEVLMAREIMEKTI